MWCRYGAAIWHSKLLYTLCGFLVGHFLSDVVSVWHGIAIKSCPKKPDQSRTTYGERASSCAKRIVHYRPSSWEIMWSDNIKQLQNDDLSWGVACEVVRRDVRIAKELTVSIARRMEGDLAHASEHLSYHVLRDCMGVESKVYMEPLSGALRHPLAFCFGDAKNAGSGGVGVFNKSYILIPHASEVLTPGSMSYLFDIGAGVYHPKRDALSYSPTWFAAQYRGRGIAFDRILSWEARLTAPKWQWAHVPAVDRHRTSWFNVPVTAKKHSPDNPWTALRELCKPEDFVVIKLDIDAPGVELALVDQLLQDEDLLQLVDDFYFEHHTYGQPMVHMGWKGALERGGRDPGMISDSYHLFAEFRNKGVRAHSWI